MSFCKFSSDYLIETFTLVDNLFINEYMLCATENQIKAYLYGLYLCNIPSEKAGSLEDFSHMTGIDEDELTDIFSFWEDNGLLQIVSKNPLEVKYLSIKGAKQPPKKYKSEKYYEFNIQLDALFPNRPLVQNEYLLIYEFIDTYKITTDAMLMIIQYGIKQKGVTVRIPYILAIARSWVADGVKTIEDVENKLNEYAALDENMRALLKAFGRRGTSIDLEEKQLYIKWTKNWGFEQDSILYSAASSKKGGFKKLDQTLDEYYRMNIFSKKEMAEYVEHRERMKSLAYKLNTTIGVYYESVDHEIEVYINPWLAEGYDEEAILTIAKYCFVSNIRTLQGMDNYVKKFYKLGVITTDSINQYMEEQVQTGNTIKNILEATGTTRAVTQSDRDFYRVWCMDWGFTDDIIIYAAQKSAQNRFPIPAINKLLASWKEQKLYTLDEVKKAVPDGASYDKKRERFNGREYTKEELRAAFSDLDNFNNIDI